jgi:hypothetical protein
VVHPYLNYHRPCGFATVTRDAQGKQRKVYALYQTPYGHFQSLPKNKQRLRRGVTLADLDRTAGADSDTEFACRMQKAQHELFQLGAQAGAATPAPLQNRAESHRKGGAKR